MNLALTIQVNLWVGTIPYLSWVAGHYWLEIVENNRCERWEVWQIANQSSESWHHLHKNLWPSEHWFASQTRWQEASWTGDEANRIAIVLRQSPKKYPHIANYRYWPGPNSNAYIQWILNTANVCHILGTSAIGKDAYQWFNLKWEKQFKIISVPLFELIYFKKQHFEITLFGLSLGYNSVNKQFLFPSSHLFISKRINDLNKNKQ